MPLTVREGLKPFVFHVTQHKMLSVTTSDQILRNSFINRLNNLIPMCNGQNVHTLLSKLTGGM